MKTRKHLFPLFCALQITYWGIYASFMAYFSAFMLANGTPATLVSLILSLYLMAAFMGSFFWGMLSDKLRTNRKTFLMQIVLCLISGLLIYRFHHITVLVAILYPLLGFATVPVASNLDSWIIKTFPADSNYYGISRAVSAIGYGILALLVGQLVSRVGYQVLPVGLTIFTVLSLVIAFIQPDSPQDDSLSSSAGFSKEDMGHLVKNRSYMTLIIILFFIGITVVPVSNMKIVLYESVGGDIRWVGYDSFIGCMIQFPFFMLAGRLKKLNPSLRLVIASLGPALLLVFYYLANIPHLIIAGSVFYFAGYSILLPAYREIGASSVEPRLMTTAQSLLDAVFASLAGMTGLLYSGYVMDTYGVKTLVLIGMFIYLIPLTLVIFRWRKSRNTV